jgi:hypothetical protein
MPWPYGPAKEAKRPFEWRILKTVLVRCFGRFKNLNDQSRRRELKAKIDTRNVVEFTGELA